jgi:predicted phosphodiesterase
VIGVRVAAIYDVHGNLPALDAVLDDVRRENVDLIVVGGDVLPGPMPREALARLLALDTPTRFIHGNGEAAVLMVLRGDEPVTVPEPFRDIVRWTAARLENAQAAAIAGWPATFAQDIDGVGRVLFCHATPRSDTEIFTRLTPAADIRAAFEDVAADVVVCGHTHMQFDRTIGGLRVVNAGSVGMPFGLPGADWLLVGPGIELRHTSYDLERAAQRIRASEYPHADAFAERNVLAPPSEEDMLRAYGS